MGFALSLAFLVAAIAVAASRAHAAEPEKKAAPAGAPKPTAVDHALAIVATGDPRKIAAAAIAAHQAGDPQLASVLTAHATKAAAAKFNAGRGVVYPSPFDAVATPAWSSWVHAQRGNDPKAITPGYNLGLFRMGMRRLVDLGLATNPRKEEVNGRKVWVADWIPQLQPGPDKYLADPDLQYRTFMKSVSNDYEAITKELPNAIGSDVDGVKATASGLLALAKIAGVEGLKQWLSDPKVREAHKPETELFKKLNGVF